MKYPIVVGTDLTKESDEALIQADARAARDGTRLTVVHAMSPLLWGTAHEGEYVEGLRESVRQQVTALTRRSEKEYDVLVERGVVHTVLARVAVTQHALLVVGHHMHHGIGHALLRDVTERVVECARGPVLVARPCSGSRRILVAVDRPFGPSSTLEIALDEARSSDSKLTVLHCVNMGFIQTLATDIINGGAYADHPLRQGTIVSEARHALQSELRRRRVDADLRVVEGEAHSLISLYAARLDADLIIVGTSHRPAPTPHVTTSVLRYAPCSVLVVDDGAALVSARPPLQIGPS